jgi:hypothetical protein
LSAVELVEFTGSVPVGDSGGFEFQIVRRWRADPALFSGGGITDFDSQVFSIPYTLADPAKRSFQIRAYDRAGNSSRTTWRTFRRWSVPIKINGFTATPASLPTGGGAVTLSWNVAYASVNSIDPGVGPLASSLNGSYGSKVVNVTANTTFTLTSSDPVRLTKTATASVIVLADTTAPTVALSANPSAVVAPGGSTLNATATDATGVSRVEFYRGNTLIGTDFSAPYQQALNFTLADIGSHAFTARAYDAANNVGSSAQLMVTVAPDTTPPTISLSANPTAQQVPGSTTLTAVAADAFGISKVEFYRGATLIATDFSAPYSHSVAFAAADVGSVSFTARAFDPQGNSSLSAAVVVSVSGDSTAPVVSLLASPGTVLLPGGTTLTATATDAVGVSKVEFYRGATLIATDLAAPFTHDVSFTAADIGNVSFTAKAFDAQGNHATSAASVVAVSQATNGDAYASPSGVDTGNSLCLQATPCLTITKAASVAQANKTVWLADGSYSASEVSALAGISIPAGLTLRALTPGQAVIKRGLKLLGSGTVVGVVLDGGAGAANFIRIEASTGTVLLEGIKFIGMLHSDFSAIIASGTAQVSLSPGGVADYTDTLLPGGGTRFAKLSGSAQLSIDGGSLGGTALGGGQFNAFLLGVAAFQLNDSARLVINNTLVKVTSGGILMNGAATQVTLTNSTLMSVAMPGPGFGIYAYKGTPAITLVDSTISGFAYGTVSAPIRVGEVSAPFGNVNGAVATISLTNAVLTGGSFGITVRDGLTPSLATITGNNAQVKNNLWGGIHCEAACNVDLSGGEVSGNGTSNATLANGNAFFGGLWLGATGKAYSLKLRNVGVLNNASLSTGSTNTAANSGVTMAGTAASSWDLGTLASPGGNTFTGNTTGSQTSGLNVAVAAGVTVSAVGNTFAANIQGANALGKYVLGTSPCGAASCNLTTGLGANYRVSSGTLKAAQ